MSRLTVNVPDDVLLKAELRVPQSAIMRGPGLNRSALVTKALEAYLMPAPRSEMSGRGRTETLRAVRAARVALDDVEATLTQQKPVQRRVKRTGLRHA